VSTDVDPDLEPAADEEASPPPPDGDAADGTGAEGVERAEATGDDAGRSSVHRLRDLSAEGKVVAALLGLGLVLAQVVSLVHFGPDWAPGGDVALMGVRSRDALTELLPLLGQPSTSGLYGGFERHAFHPGPMQFYMTAPVMRVLGANAGMMIVAILITASSALVAAWAIFRQLGAYAGVVGAVVISLVMFTTGSSSLLNPISSNISGYPLLCGAVLVWCLVCGDDRLLPLAVGYLSFAGQAHLSVGPAVGVLVIVGLVAVAVTWWRAGIRRDPAVRRHALRWGGGSALLGLLLWLPVIYQQFHGDPGNVTALMEFTSDNQRPALGLDAAIRQLGHVLGLPPLLGQTQLVGFDLIEPVGFGTWLTAGLVLAVLAVAGFRWRKQAPRRSALVLMVGVLVVCGLVNGSNVPDSVERARLSFYHWAWPLTILVVVGLALVVADVARQVAGRRHWFAGGIPRPLGAGLVGVALVAMVVPTLVNPSLDRITNNLSRTGTLYPRSVYNSLVGQALDAGVGDVDGEVVVVGTGGPIFDGTVEGLSLQLMEHGVDVAFPLYARDFVANEHLIEKEDLGAVLVVVTEGVDGPPPGLPGEEIGRVPVAKGFDREAYDEVVAAAETVDDPDDLQPGAEFQAFYDGLDDNQRRIFDIQVRKVFEDPGRWFFNQDIVDFFIDYPMENPEIDPAALQRLSDSFPPGFEGGPPAMDLSLRLVTGDDAERVLHFGDTRSTAQAGDEEPVGSDNPLG
jgi:hypothetical protein